MKIITIIIIIIDLLYNMKLSEEFCSDRHLYLEMAFPLPVPQFKLQVLIPLATKLCDCCNPNVRFQ